MAKKQVTKKQTKQEANQSTAIEVFGSELSSIRTKAVSVIAAQATLEGYRVLLTERDSSQLKTLLANTFSDDDELKLYTVEGVPSDRYLIAVAEQWSEKTEEKLLALSKSYDLTIFSCGNVLSESTASNRERYKTINVLAGNYDGHIFEETLELSQQLDSTKFICAVPDKLPLYYDQSVASAKEKLNLANNSWDLPLYNHIPFTVPKAEEVTSSLWDKASEVIAAFNTPLDKNSTRKVKASLVANALPARVNGGTELIPLSAAKSIENIATMLASSQRNIEQLNESMKSHLDRIKANSNSLHENSAAIKSQREQAKAHADETVLEDENERKKNRLINREQMAIQIKQSYANDQAQNTTNAQELHTQQRTILNRVKSEPVVEVLDAQIEAVIEPVVEAVVEPVVEVLDAQIEASKITNVALADKKVKLKLTTVPVGEIVIKTKNVVTPTIAVVATEAAKVEPATKPPPNPLGTRKKIVARRITRSSEVAVVHFANTEELEKIVKPQKLQGLLDKCVVDTKLNIPDLLHEENLSKAFIKLRNYMFGLPNKTRDSGGAYACALLSLLLAEKASQKDNPTLVRVSREFARDAFALTLKQKNGFSLAHWFLNTVWLTEHKINSDDKKSVLDSINKLVELLYRTKEDIDSQIQLDVMRSVLALMLARVEEQMTGYTKELVDRSFENYSQLKNKLPPEIAKAIVYDKPQEEKSKSVNETVVKNSVKKAKDSFGELA